MVNKNDDSSGDRSSKHKKWICTAKHGGPVRPTAVVKKTEVKWQKENEYHEEGMTGRKPEGSVVYISIYINAQPLSFSRNYSERGR